MIRGLEGLNSSNPAAQLTMLVLRVVGQLSPCTRATLVARISGEQPSEPPIEGIVSAVLNKLQEFGFVQLDSDDDVSITEGGRRFLEQPPEAALTEALNLTGYVGTTLERLKALGQNGFTAARAVAGKFRRKRTDDWGEVDEELPTEAEGFGQGGVKAWAGTGGRRRLMRVGGAVAAVGALVLAGMTFLGGSDADTSEETLLIGKEELVAAAPIDAPADEAPLADKGASSADEDATAASEPGYTQSEPGADPAAPEMSQDPTDASAPAPPEAAAAEAPAEPSIPESSAPEIELAAVPSDSSPESSQTDPSASADSEAALPADSSTESLAEPAAGEQGAADPIVMAIREKLADPVMRKGATTEELDALEAFYAERESPIWISGEGFSAKAEATMKEIADADSWGLPADALGLPSASDRPESTDTQAAAEIELALAALKYARFAGGGRLVPARISPLFDQTPRLPDPKKVLTDIAASDSPDTYLQSLHPQQEQFQRLRKALVKARAGKKRTTPEIQRLVVNMERWRWMPDDLGSYHVWNNVPEFSVRVMRRGKTVYSEKVIVGQRKYATPIFSAPMRTIVFHPDWVVPETIVREDLKPALQAGGFFGGPSTGILRRHNLQVSFNGRPVEADSVDWIKENLHQYTFTQPAGPDNVLGVLKFNFPNRHAIYMHDTPQRELFNETVLTFSHGCIRVREPDRLASILLAEDKGWPAQKIKAMLDEGKRTTVSLGRPVPVHLTYFTAVADDKGKVETFADIYGLDSRMSAALFKKPAKFDAPQVEAKAEWRPRNTGLRAIAGGGIAGEISGLFSN
jgi:murein L,D-transpeptidase YcbB/YkuD